LKAVWVNSTVAEFLNMLNPKTQKKIKELTTNQHKPYELVVRNPGITSS